MDKYQINNLGLALIQRYGEAYDAITYFISGEGIIEEDNFTTEGEIHHILDGFSDLDYFTEDDVIDLIEEMEFEVEWKEVKSYLTYLQV